MIVLLLIGAAFSACSVSGAKKPPFLAEGYQPAFNYTDPSSTSPPFFRSYVEASNILPEERARRRNQVLRDIRTSIDASYYQFEQDLRTDRTFKDAVTKMVAMALTLAATAVDANSTKTVLTAIATGVIGASAIVDEEVFINQTTQALQLEMQRLRAQQLIPIEAGMGNAYSVYPLESGLNDMVVYYHAGSVTKALESVVQTAGTELSHAQYISEIVRKLADINRGLQFDGVVIPPVTRRMFVPESHGADGTPGSGSEALRNEVQTINPPVEGGIIRRAPPPSK